jgi:acetyltransferase-like isoleucine patch superfamily enzyme
MRSFGFRSRIASPDIISYPSGISIGERVNIWKHSRIEVIPTPTIANPSLSIGDDTVIHPYFHAGAAESVTIGKDVLIASRVYVSDHDHVYNHPTLPARWSKELVTRPVIIEDGVWIGEGCVILKGVTIGKRSVIAANSVVTKDVPPLTVVGGNPAKTIKSISL